MHYEPISVLKLDCSNPRVGGQKHGEELREQIRGAASVRWELMRKELGFDSDAKLKAVALEHLPILKKFDEHIYNELLGIAEGSKEAVERIVVLNQYTDLRDLNCSIPSTKKDTSDDGGCSTLFVPTEHGPILGQTWDIHSSALPFVVLLDIEQTLDDGSSARALVFSMAGCLGMTGMSSQGVAITINNLCSTDARIGLIWPALVRKVLKQKNALAGKDCILDAFLGSGHHYVVADNQRLFAISTSGTKKKIITQNAQAIHFHTNHCVDEEMAQTHIVKPESTTYVRYNTLEHLIKERCFDSNNDVYEAFGEVSMTPKGKDSSLVGTCGAIVMDITQKTVFACSGPPSQKIHHNPPSIFQL